MRGSIRLCTFVSVAALTVGLAAGPAMSGPRQITLKAKKFEWDPAKIEVRVDEVVEVTLLSEDVKHGFICKGLKIKAVKFKKDQPAMITFTAERPGTFRFKCADFCGLGHRRMKGEVVVKP